MGRDGPVFSSESAIIKYIITPSVVVQVYDPNISWPWWKAVLHFFLLVRRPRMAIVYAPNAQGEAPVVCHPKSVPAVSKFLKVNGHQYTVRPNLQALKGGQ